MKSRDIKPLLIQYLILVKKCLVAKTEFYNHADVFGVTKQHYGIEIEIKTAITDFRNELKTIRYILNPESDMGYGHYRSIDGTEHYYQKFDKHRSYLWDEADHSPRPRYFYFAVPEEMMMIAHRNLVGSPYGLLIIYERNGQGMIDEVIRPKALTKNTVHPEILTKMGIDI